MRRAPQMSTCDEELAGMEEMLGRFQGDLAGSGAQGGTGPCGCGQAGGTGGEKGTWPRRTQ